VVKAVNAGRIFKEPDGTIDPIRADADWKRHTRVSMATPDNASARLAETPPSEAGRSGGVPDYRTSRSIRMLYEAKLSKLKIGVREGRMGDIDEINRATFNRARRARDRLLMIPRRLAAQIAAESSADKRDILAEAFNDALEDMAHTETTLTPGVQTNKEAVL
jgi:hypothetical protein